MIARTIQLRTGGRWLCWYGHTTEHYWAMPRPPYPWWGLVEGDTPARLAALISQIEFVYGRAW